MKPKFLVVLELLEGGVDVHALFSTKKKAEKYVKTYKEENHVADCDSLEIVELKVDEG